MRGGLGSHARTSLDGGRLGREARVCSAKCRQTFEWRDLDRAELARERPARRTLEASLRDVEAQLAAVGGAREGEDVDETEAAATARRRRERDARRGLDEQRPVAAGFPRKGHELPRRGVPVSSPHIGGGENAP